MIDLNRLFSLGCLLLGRLPVGHVYALDFQIEALVQVLVRFIRRHAFLARLCLDLEQFSFRLSQALLHGVYTLLQLLFGLGLVD